jgi:phosphomannomutase
MTLSQYKADLPDFPMAYDLVTVHGPDKGGVLRELTDQFPQNEKEPEGVRLMLSSGSALVTPDSFEPMFHIYAEGKSVFDCEETVERVVALIQSILAQTKP